MGRIGLAVSPAEPDTVYAIVEAAAKDRRRLPLDRRAARAGRRRATTSPRARSTTSEIFADPKRRRPRLLDGHLPAGHRRRRQDLRAGWARATSTSTTTRSGSTPTTPTTCSSAATAALYESFDRGGDLALQGQPADHPVLPRRGRRRAAVLQRLRRHAGQQHARRPVAHDQPRTASPTRDWFVTVGGDGFHAGRRPAGPEHRLRRVAARRPGPLRPQHRRARRHPAAAASRASAPLRWNWDSPLIVSPHSHTRLYFARAAALPQRRPRRQLDARSAPDLTRQIDRNTLKVMGRVWSVDAVAKNASTSFYGNIVVARRVAAARRACSTSAPTTASSRSARTAAPDWRKVGQLPGRAARARYVSALVASRHDADVVYAAFDNHKMGDFKPYLLRAPTAAAPGRRSPATCRRAARSTPSPRTRERRTCSSPAPSSASSSPPTAARSGCS